MNYYIKALKNYANFSGRARRKEYWMFVLFQILFVVAAAILDHVLGTTFKFLEQPLPYGWVYLIYVLATVIPGLALAVRRLHDVNKSGWYYLMVLIPIIGSILVLIKFCTEGVPEENKWGKNPKTENY